MVLEPYGYVGPEEHLVPLSAEFVAAMYMGERRMELVLPKGVHGGGGNELSVGYPKHLWLDGQAPSVHAMDFCASPFTRHHANIHPNLIHA